MKKRESICALVLALVLLATCFVPVSADDTAFGVVNGGFETVDNGAVTGWNLIETTWEEVLKTDGASGKGDNYALLAAADTSKNFGLEQKVQIEKNKRLHLSFWYKSTIKSALTLDLYFYDSASPVNSTIGTQKKEMAATGGEWKKYNLILDVVKADVENGDEVYSAVADGVTIRFRNIAKSLGKADADMAIDEVTLTEHDDLLLDKGFNEGSDAFWGDTGTVTFENGYVKMTGAAGEAYITQSTSVPTTDMLYGFTQTRFRVSFKFKSDTEGIQPTVKLYDVPAAGGETNLNLTKRQTTVLENGWTEYIYYSASSSATAASIGLMLRGSGADVTVYYDDVDVSPAVYWIYDNNIKEVSTLTEGAKINVSAIVPNRSDAELNSMVVVAFYETSEGVDRLLSVDMQTPTVEAKKNVECRINMTVPAKRRGGTLKMKCFILNSELEPIEWVAVLTQ